MAAVTADVAVPSITDRHTDRRHRHIDSRRTDGRTGTPGGGEWLTAAEAIPRPHTGVKQLGIVLQGHMFEPHL